MPDGSIRISRERDSYCVCLTDPEIAKQNQNSDSSYQDPYVEYTFDTKEQVLAFIEKAIDIALPKDDYSSAFDKIAKEVEGNE